MWQSQYICGTSVFKGFCSCCYYKVYWDVDPISLTRDELFTWVFTYVCNVVWCHILLGHLYETQSLILWPAFVYFLVLISPVTEHVCTLVFQLWLNRVHSSLSMFCSAVRHCGGGQSRRLVVLWLSCDRAMRYLQKEIVEVRCLHPLRKKPQTSVSTYTTPAVNTKPLWRFSVIVTTPSSFPPAVSMLLTLR